MLRAGRRVRMSACEEEVGLSLSFVLWERAQGDSVWAVIVDFSFSSRPVKSTTTGATTFPRS